MIHSEHGGRINSSGGKMFMQIFLWFLIALTIISAVGIMSAYFTHQGMTQISMKRELGEVLDKYADQTLAAYENSGAAGLEAFLKSISRQVFGKISLFYADGRPVLEEAREHEGPPVPSKFIHRLEKFVSKAAKQKGDVFSADRRMASMARSVTASGGQVFVITIFRPVPPPLPMDSVGAFMLRLLSILVAGACACYWLANHIAIPIRQLREATYKLSVGEMSTRVKDNLMRRNDEIGDLGRAFNGMAEHLEELIGAQNRLLGDISHELRTPLARLNIALELARKRSGPEAASALDRIELETERLSDMIGQLLMLSRFETYVRRIEKSRIDLPELLADIVKDARFEAADKGCKVLFDAPEDIYISGDPTLIARAVENVTRNAIRHTPGGKNVSLGLALSEDGRETVTTIKDEGPGVMESELENIFRPFYRLDKARDRKTGGTGLGLSIAERAVKLHGGTITAGNAHEGGLVVEIRLPVEYESPSASKGTA